MRGTRRPWAGAALLSAVFLLHGQAVAAVSFQVLAPADPLYAPLGGSVVLPCQLSPALSARAMQVTWSRPRQGQDVHEYWLDGHEEQGPAYRGRTELLRDGIQQGRLALRIWNLTLPDEGPYLCDIRSNATRRSGTVTLHLTRAGSDPHLHVREQEHEGVSVTCLSAGWYPEPDMLWRNSHEEIQTVYSAEKRLTEDGFFNLSSSVVLTAGSDPALSCMVKPGAPGPEKVSAILISDVFFPSVSPWRVPLFVILAFWVGALSLAAFLVLRLCRAKGAVNATLDKNRGRPSWKGAFLRAANVTLDPRTAHPCLELSPDGKALSNTGPRPALHDAPGRFDVYACVLGAEGYTAGTHFWDVQVPGAGGWALGVTRASAGRKGRVPFSPEHGTWAIQLSMGEYRALSAEWVPLAPPRRPGKIRVYLDYEGGVVAFYDAETTAPLHAFSASFHGPILPFFWVWSVGTSLRLCH
ncbi:butyrophilin subfamily 1 member A1-like [Pelodiscus sinensis]|uniref:butyrophilin subfamily 1 member A1-like n=1 Tax=Pelodiscus sinensis TaxID=13735 RepID=UPI003F6C97C8